LHTQTVGFSFLVLVGREIKTLSPSSTDLGRVLSFFPFFFSEVPLGTLLFSSLFKREVEPFVLFPGREIELTHLNLARDLFSPFWSVFFSFFLLQYTLSPFAFSWSYFSFD